MTDNLNPSILLPNAQMQQPKLLKLTSLRFVTRMNQKMGTLSRRRSKLFSVKVKPPADNTFINVLRENIIKGITNQSVIDFLMIPKFDRKLSMVKTISEFLAARYAFFNELYVANREKVYAIVSLLNVERYTQHEAIIRYGEEGTKFFIILKGGVAVLKPRMVQRFMSPKDFVKNLQMMKYIEKDDLKLQRIEAMNSAQYDLARIKKLNYDYKKFSKESKQPFYEEIEEKITEKKEGQSFGEVALLQKVTRTATIRALDDDCFIASITKGEYNKIIKHLEEKAFVGKIDGFKQDFSMLKHWTKKSVIKLFNAFVRRNYIKGDHFYRQGDWDSNIYFLISGSCTIYVDITFGALDAFITYIHSNRSSIISSIRRKTKLLAAGGIEAFLKGNINKEKRYPIDFNSATLAQLSDINDQDELVRLKIKEARLKNPAKLFRIKIRSSYPNEVFGLEEAFDLKQRFVSVVCSSNAIVQVVKLADFIGLLINRDIQLGSIETIINEKKEVLINTIRRIVMEQDRVISRQLKNEYDKVMQAISPEAKFNNKEVNVRKVVQLRFFFPIGKKRNKSVCLVKGKDSLKVKGLHRKKREKSQQIELSDGKMNMSDTSFNSRNKLPFKLKGVYYNGGQRAPTDISAFESELFKIPGLFTTDRYTRPHSNYSLRKEDISLLSINSLFSRDEAQRKREVSSYSYSSCLSNTTFSSSKANKVIYNGIESNSLYHKVPPVFFQGRPNSSSTKRKTRNQLIKAKAI